MALFWIITNIMLLIKEEFMIGYAILGYGMGIWLLIIVYKGCIKVVIDTRFSKDVVVLEGKVVDFAQVKNIRRTGYLVCPVISFSYNGVSNQELTADRNSRYFFVNKYKLNQKVLICYNPTLFEKMVVIKDDYRDIWEAVMFFIMALYFLGIGIAATYYGIKYDIFI